MTDTIRSVIDTQMFLWVWGINTLIAEIWLIYDLRKRNPEIGGIMKWVWALTVLYSGLLGLALYFYSGRKQIARDSLWRKGCRSVAHCYSGCGAGEVIGVLISVGAFAMGNLWVALITFSLAYIFGVLLTIGPLMQDGEPFGTALKDAIISETASIVIMEAVAIGVDLWLAGKATINDPLFWSSLIVSLTIGLIAAYPVNVLLIKWGVKEGMHNPREMAQHAHG